MSNPPTSTRTGNGILDFIEWLGNKIPEPAVLFALFAALVVVIAALGDAFGWKVQPVQPKVQLVEKKDASGNVVTQADGKPVMIPVLGPDGRPEIILEKKGDPIAPRTLLTSEGIYWMFSSMLRNFTHLPALGLIFVSILGIGLAEKFGMFQAAMRWLAQIAPKPLLTPIIVMVGANSSLASDAGYIILPPLAAALYAAMGRSPIAGLAAAFSGVAGGFCAGFSLNASDTFMAGQAQQAAQIIDPERDVLPTANWVFKGVSVFVLMVAGWLVTDKIVEPRLLAAEKKAAPGGDVGDQKTIHDMSLSPIEKKGLIAALLTMIAVTGAFLALIFIPGAPLYGEGQQTLANGHVLMSGPAAALKGEGTNALRLLEAPGHRWAHVIVPMMLFIFLLPGMAYGLVVGTLRSQKDFVDALQSGVKSIVPVLLIMFFLAQFVEYFKYTQLDRMLAYAGGQLLVSADLPIPVLIVAFILIVIAGDFAMSGLMSKFAVMAPIFVPMFMFVGISPELMMAGYRIGDSVVNVVTPLNSYALIVLAVLQKYKPGAGLGTQIALMLPYSVVYFLFWTGLLLVWYMVGADLGPGGPLTYTPPH
ncbi:MAG: AbgT family transporter [Phycisphaerales bacterium]|nr:AbgT family transporter [Phycisphaerales bacterium]